MKEIKRRPQVGEIWYVDCVGNAVITKINDDDSFDVRRLSNNNGSYTLLLNYRDEYLPYANTKLFKVLNNLEGEDYGNKETDD